MKRRDILFAAPLMGVGVVCAAQASTSSRIMRLYGQWIELHARLNGQQFSAMAPAEITADLALKWEIEAEIAGVAAVTPEEFIAKVIVMTDHGEHGLPCQADDPELWHTASALIAA